MEGRSLGGLGKYTVLALFMIRREMAGSLQDCRNENF